MEMKGSKLRGLMLLLAATALVVVVSCGGGGGDGGDTGSDFTDPQKAASTMEAAKGAADLTVNMGMASSMLTGAIPPEVPMAPGRKAGTPSLESVGKIDPQLQQTAEKMFSKMQSRNLQGALGKTKTLSATRSAVSSSSTTTVPCNTGSYTVITSLVTGTTTTTANFSVAYANCMDLTFHEKINGTISGSYSTDSLYSSESSTVTANLTFTDYDTDNTTVLNTFVMNGTFTASNIAGTSGLNTAKGTFTWTTPTPSGNVVSAFSFGSGSAPITDAWTIVSDTFTTTVERTGNGSYGLSMSSPGGSMGLTVTLRNLVSKVLTDSVSFNTDYWINGSVSISWSPDMSQWGCLNGTYVFTTVTPVHTPFPNFCPTSGKISVNNATIEYGKPAGEQVTVTVNGVSRVFTDCLSWGGGFCN